MEDTSKPCRVCGVVQPLTEFYRAEGCVDGRRHTCRTCFQAKAKARADADPRLREEARRRTAQWILENEERYRAQKRAYGKTEAYRRSQRRAHLKAKYGLTVDGYEAMLAAQGGRCAICRRRPRDGQALHVDHDHRTGQVRGLLCFTCNAALGQLHDAPELVRRAATYLWAHRRDDRTARRIRRRVAALALERPADGRR